MVFLAWHIEVMARQDHKRTLPPLARFLGREEEPEIPKEQTGDEILAAMRSWAAMTRKGEE